MNNAWSQTRLNEKLIISLKLWKSSLTTKNLCQHEYWHDNTNGAKHLVILHWNFWNHSFSLTKVSFRHLIAVACRPFSTYYHHSFIFKIVDFLGVGVKKLTIGMISVLASTFSETVLLSRVSNLT